jgi:hypothetical protein
MNESELEAKLLITDLAPIGQRVLRATNGPPGGGSAELCDGFTVMLPSPVSSADGQAGRPTRFHLAEAFPNPFNGSVVIRYSVPEMADVEITILDLLGRLVAVLFSGKRDPGEYEIRWTPDSHASGVYLVHMSAHSESSSPGYRALRKIVALK